MGGKKKKSEAHPAASLAAPATATASVGSSDAAASGTTASLNKKKNPRQPSAKSAAKEIKAKGIQRFMFNLILISIPVGVLLKGMWNRFH